MTRSPSKVVRGAILSAFAGVISIGISPGTLAIVLSGISPSFGELVGLSGVLSATSDQPAVNISSPADTASVGSALASGLGTELVLVHAGSDADGSPGVGSASADGRGNGLPANLLALNDASLGSIGAQSFGSSASVNSGSGAFNRSGTTSPRGASLSIADTPFILSENPAPSTTQTDAGSPVIVSKDIPGTTPTDAGSPPIVLKDNPGTTPTDAGGPPIVLKDIPGGDAPGGPPVNDNFPSEDVVPDSVRPVASPLPLFDNPAGNEAQAITPAQEEVPAPATLLLLLAGMPGLWLLRRRRGRPTDGSGKV